MYFETYESSKPCASPLILQLAKMSLCIGTASKVDPLKLETIANVRDALDVINTPGTDFHHTKTMPSDTLIRLRQSFRNTVPALTIFEKSIKQELSKSLAAYSTHPTHPTTGPSLPSACQ